MNDIPSYIKEGRVSEWESHFAWAPVQLQEGGIAWMRRVHRRRFFPPSWYVDPAPLFWWEYSAIPASIWELRARARAALAEQEKEP